MAMVIRVRFKRAAKLYDFDPNGLELHNGMSVVTETARGVELGECMSGVMDVPDERLVLPLKPILRIATEQDLAMQKRHSAQEKAQAKENGAAPKEHDTADRTPSGDGADHITT